MNMQIVLVFSLIHLSLSNFLLSTSFSGSMSLSLPLSDCFMSVNGIQDVDRHKTSWHH
jgi:hypothetical protein